MAEKEPRGDEGVGRSSPSPLPKLDLWMLKWLQVHRPDLEIGIQSIVIEVLTYLVQKGRIDPIQSAVYQEIESSATVPVQKARKLLDWLRAQSPVVFWAFQQAIVHSSLPHEAKRALVATRKETREMMSRVEAMSLSDKLSLRYSESVLKARERMQRFYSSRDQLHLCAGFGKGKTLPMEQVAVNVCLLSEGEARAAFGGRGNPSLESCFNDTQVCSTYLFSKALQSQASLLSLERLITGEEGGCVEDNTLALGGAGCGKSVCFTRKAPYEWALGRLWTKIAPSVLFCLDLRDKNVWQATTIPELLKFSELGLSQREQDEVLEFISTHPRQIILVCDGLDEASVNQNSLLWRVLTNTCLGIPASLRVIVSTRPCESAETVGTLCHSSGFKYKKVEVAGFTQGDIELFTVKYLGQDNGIKLLSDVDRQPHIQSLMHAPLFCLLVCDIFQEKQELPCRKTALFEKIVTGLLRRYASSRAMKKTFYSLSEAPAQLRKKLLALGKLAFQGLEDRQLLFTSADLENAAVSTEALELGLLTKSESDEFWKSDKYTFFHSTLQEFLSALFVSEKKIRGKKDVARTGRETGRWWFFCHVLGVSCWPPEQRG